VRNKFRTHGPDVMQTPRPNKIAPGRIGDGKLGVYDHKGRLRGQVGKLATSVTAARFTGTTNNTLGKKDGRDAWIGAAPKKPNSAAQQQMAKLRASLRADRGSVSSRDK
jgi:hypothetical protein